MGTAVSLTRDLVPRCKGRPRRPPLPNPSASSGGCAPTPPITYSNDKLGRFSFMNEKRPNFEVGSGNDGKSPPRPTVNRCPPSFRLLTSVKSSERDGPVSFGRFSNDWTFVNRCPRLSDFVTSVKSSERDGPVSFGRFSNDGRPIGRPLRILGRFHRCQTSDLKGSR